MVGVCEAARPPTMRAMSVLPLTVDRRDDGASAWQTLVGATLPESIRFDILRPLRCQSETSSQYAAGGRRARCFRVDLSSGLLIGPDQTRHRVRHRLAGLLRERYLPATISL